MDILCVGQMVADILIQGVDEVDFSIDTKRVKSIVIKNGGDCLNTAIDLRSLGNEVAFAGALGYDAMGDYLSQTLKAYGIDDNGIKYLNNCETSTVVGLINFKGDRVFLYYGGTNDVFCFDHINLDLVKESKIVHVGGTFQLPGFDGVGTAKLFKLAHSYGKFTSMDVTWDTTGKWLETIEPCLMHLDLFMPSINEAKEIAGTNCPEEIADFLKKKGVKNIIIKLGKDGCYVNAFGEEFYQPSFDVEVVDTTGAGDSFVAGVLTGLNKGWDIRRSVVFASAVSAKCIQKLGATTGVPSFGEVMAFIEEQDKIKTLY